MVSRKVSDKMNGLAKGGLITAFVGAGICCLGAIIIFASTSTIVALFGSSITTSTITILGVLILIFPLLIIILGSVAMVKKSNGLRIACGVLCFVAIFFAWVAYFVPALLFLIGGILTLCGKAE
ncbi:hypothetical protein SHELI_v1c08790 [Spiroplasma helicoides]|uniref:DUF4064 domain-containing protein n=1 Tax=Spiroplasma helicoides TaxID=216938 RepID=A0A1B3SLM2_9MOLU|nr:hypothetical protein [Spiroplasma helicoides]AOG60828.1 hypothetical protein SHELI_v1c08790 [Spiroplasma helicoides]